MDEMTLNNIGLINAMLVIYLWMYSQKHHNLNTLNFGRLTWSALVPVCTIRFNVDLTKNLTAS